MLYLTKKHRENFVNFYLKINHEKYESSRRLGGYIIL